MDELYIVSGRRRSVSQKAAYFGVRTWSVRPASMRHDEGLLFVMNDLSVFVGCQHKEQAVVSAPKQSYKQTSML